MLSNKVVESLTLVAMDLEVQMCVISAMFHGCERGTDLWENLEENSHKFLPATCKLLWGEAHLPTDDEEEDEEEDPNSLYVQSPPHEVIEKLLDLVEDNLLQYIDNKMAEIK